MDIRTIRRPDIGGHLHWSSAFAGAVIAGACGVFFLMLGNAIGLNVTNPGNAGVSSALRFWSFIYFAVTVALSYFLGGLTSKQAYGDYHNSISSLMSWGLITVFVFAGGVFSIPGFRTVALGQGANAFNWLTLVVVALGIPASILGGLIGRSAARTELVEERERRKA